MVKNMSTEQVYLMRPKGKIIPRVKPVVSGAEPEQQQNQNQNQKPSAAITKGEKKPLPNRLCYPELFKGRIGPKGEWLGGRVPKCKRCQGNLYPEENHVCEGFKPMFPVLDEETLEIEREAMREAKRGFQNFDDYDDDQYDPTTPGGIPLEEDYCENV